MNQETLDKMRRMRLFGMYHAFKSGMETPRSEPYTADEMTSMLIESEWDDRHNRALDRGLRNAKFRYKATIEQVENAEQRGIDKNQLHRLADGSSIKEMNRLEKQDLLILDDFGIQPFDNQSRSSLMEIIEDRHGKRSTIITSQLPIKGWYEVIGEQTIADAILDRVVHNAHRIELKGESLRKKQITKEEEKE